MNRLVVAAAFVVVLVGLPLTAEAACRWTWDCTQGPCRQVQVCDSALDGPTIRPPEIAPMPASTIRPIPQPVVPPLGTTQCAPRYVCPGGVCRWETLCR